MINKVKELVFSNISLLIIVIGSFSSFAITLIWKNQLEETFNLYTLLITFISICVSFGFLGMDQVLVRVSKLEGNNILINIKVLYMMIASSILFSIFISGIFSILYKFSFFQLFILSISLGMIVLSFNLLRLNYKFVASQIMNNSHKFLLFFVLIYFLNREFRFNDVLSLFSILVLIIGLFSVLSVRNLIRFSNESDGNIKSLWFAFLINIGLLTFIGYGDRLVIERMYGEDMMGKYFYYLTVFLFPLNLLQYYVGFKEVVRFKQGFTKKQLHLKLFQVLMLGVFVILLILSTVYFDNGRFLEVDINKDALLILSLSVLGLSKLIYGLFSAIIGAKGSSGDLFKINIYSILIIILAFLLILSIPSLSIGFVVIFLTIIFLSRSAYIYYKLVT